MADFIFNIGRGQTVARYQSVEGNDPTNSALIVMLFTGAITDATLRDLDDVAAIEADAGAAEITDGSYARKVLTSTELAAVPGPDDGNDRYDLAIPNQTWASLAGGDSITRLIVAYDDDTTVGADDANLIPLTSHDFVATSDGSDLTATINAAGFYRSS